MDWTNIKSIALQKSQEAQDKASNKKKKVVGSITLIILLGLLVFFSWNFLTRDKIIFTEDVGIRYDVAELESQFTPSNWTIEGDMVYINDSKAYISANPHTIKGGGYVEFNVLSKAYTGDIDLVFGVPSEYFRPTELQYYTPNYIEEIKDYTCDYDFNYTVSPKYFWCYTQIENENNQTVDTIIFEHSFKTGDIPTKTASWTESYWDNWTTVSGHNIEKQKLEFEGMNRWYSIKNVNVNSGQNYKFRIFIQPSQIDVPDKKYWFVIKPSNEGIYESIAKGHFYALDPWYQGLTSGLIAYYKFDETGATVIDSLSVYNGTNVNFDTGLTGKIGNAYNSSGSDYANLNWISTTGSYTFSIWLQPTAQMNPSGDRLLFDSQTGRFFVYTETTSDYLGFYDGAVSHYGMGLTYDTWKHYVFTFNGATNNASLYVNGVLSASKLEYTSKNLGGTTTLASVYNDHSNTGYTGLMDEFGIWNRTLNSTEILVLYNGGTGLTYAPPSESSVITLNTPVAFFNQSNPTAIQFNGTLLGNAKNVSLILNSTVNQTNTSMINNSDYLFTVIFPQGFYSWTYEVCSFTDTCSQPNPRNVTIHTTIPKVVITYPSGSIGAVTVGSPVTLTWNLSEPGMNLTDHFANCSYYYNGNTIYLPKATCYANATTFTYASGQNSIDFNVTDTFGLSNSSSSSWVVTISEVNQTYSNSTNEGSLETFGIFATTDSSLSIVQSDLTYNGTSTVGTTTSYGSNLYGATIPKTIPSVSANTNVTFFWTFTLNDSSTVESLHHNQTILDINISNCTIGNNVLFNFTLLDEKTQVKLNGTVYNTTIEIESLLYSSDRTVSIANFSGFYNRTNTASICFFNSIPGTSNLSLDILAKYDGDSYATEYYNIVNYTVRNNSVPQAINLYDILDADNTVFKITYKDSNFLPVPNVLIQVQRKYVSEGAYKTVELPKTDTDGSTVANLKLNDVIYTFVLTKNGQIIATFNNVIAKCNTVLSDCELNFNSYTSTISSDEYSLVEDFAFTLDYDDVSRDISSIFSIPSGIASTVWLNATLYDGLGNRSVCNSQIVSASGTLTCTVPTTFGNGTVEVEIYKGGELAGGGTIRLNPPPSSRYGGSLVFLGVILMATFIGIGASSSPLIMGAFLMVGAITLVGMNLIDSAGWVGKSATVLWILIAIALVMIKGSKRN